MKAKLNSLIEVKFSYPEYCVQHILIIIEDTDLSFADFMSYRSYDFLGKAQKSKEFKLKPRHQVWDMSRVSQANETFQNVCQHIFQLKECIKRFHLFSVAETRELNKDRKKKKREDTKEDYLKELNKVLDHAIIALVLIYHIFKVRFENDDTSPNYLNKPPFPLEEVAKLISRVFANANTSTEFLHRMDQLCRVHCFAQSDHKDSSTAQNILKDLYFAPEKTEEYLLDYVDEFDRLMIPELYRDKSIEHLKLVPVPRTCHYNNGDIYFQIADPKGNIAFSAMQYLLLTHIYVHAQKTDGAGHRSYLKYQLRVFKNYTRDLSKIDATLAQKYYEVEFLSQEGPPRKKPRVDSVQAYINKFKSIWDNLLTVQPEDEAPVQDILFLYEHRNFRDIVVLLGSNEDNQTDTEKLVKDYKFKKKTVKNLNALLLVHGLLDLRKFYMQFKMLKSISGVPKSTTRKKLNDLYTLLLDDDALEVDTRPQQHPSFLLTYKRIRERILNPKFGPDQGQCNGIFETKRIPDFLQHALESFMVQWNHKNLVKFYKAFVQSFPVQEVETENGDNNNAAGEESTEEPQQQENGDNNSAAAGAEESTEEPQQQENGDNNSVAAAGEESTEEPHQQDNGDNNSTAPAASTEEAQQQENGESNITTAQAALAEEIRQPLTPAERLQLDLLRIMGPEAIARFFGPTRGTQQQETLGSTITTAATAEESTEETHQQDNGDNNLASVAAAASTEETQRAASIAAAAANATTGDNQEQMMELEGEELNAGTPLGIDDCEIGHVIIDVYEFDGSWELSFDRVRYCKKYMRGKEKIQERRSTLDILVNAATNRHRFIQHLDFHFYRMRGSNRPEYGLMSRNVATRAAWHKAPVDPKIDYGPVEALGYDILDPDGDGNCLFYALMWAFKNAGRDKRVLPSNTRHMYRWVTDLRRVLHRKLNKKNLVKDWKFHPHALAGVENFKKDILSSIYVNKKDYSEIREEPDFHPMAEVVPRGVALAYQLRVAVLFVTFIRTKTEAVEAEAEVLLDNPNRDVETSVPVNAGERVYDSITRVRTTIWDYRPTARDGFESADYSHAYRIPDEDFDYRDTIELMHVTFPDSDSGSGHFMWLKRDIIPIVVPSTTPDDHDLSYLSTMVQVSDEVEVVNDGPTDENLDLVQLQEVPVVELIDDDDNDHLHKNNHTDDEMEDENISQKKVLSEYCFGGLLSNEEGLENIDYSFYYEKGKTAKLSFRASAFFAHWANDLHANIHCTKPNTMFKAIPPSSRQAHLVVPECMPWIDEGFGIVHENDPIFKQFADRIQEIDFGAIYDYVVANGVVDPTRCSGIRIHFGGSHLNYQSKFPRPSFVLFRHPPAIDVPDMPATVKKGIGIMADILTEILKAKLVRLLPPNTLIKVHFIDPLNDKIDSKHNMFASFTLLVSDLDVLNTIPGEEHVDDCNGREYPNSLYGNLSFHGKLRRLDGNTDLPPKFARIGLLGYGRKSQETFKKNEDRCDRIKKSFTERKDLVNRCYQQCHKPMQEFVDKYSWYNAEVATFDHPERFSIPGEVGDKCMKMFKDRDLKKWTYCYSVPSSFAPELEWSALLDTMVHYMIYEKVNNFNCPFYMHIYTVMLCYGCDMKVYLSVKKFPDPRTPLEEPRDPTICDAKVVTQLFEQLTDDWSQWFRTDVRLTERVTSVIDWREFCRDNSKMSGFVEALQTFLRDIQAKPMNLLEYYEAILQLALKSPGIHPYYLQDVGLHFALLGVVTENVSNTFLRIPVEDPTEEYKKENNVLEKHRGSSQRLERAQGNHDKLNRHINTELRGIKSKRVPVLGVWKNILTEMNLPLKWSSIDRVVKCASAYLGIEARPYWIERYFRVVGIAAQGQENDVITKDNNLYWLFRAENGNGYTAKVKIPFSETNPDKSYDWEENILYT